MRVFFVKRWRTLGLSVLCVLVAGYLAAGIIIGREVERASSLAQSRYSGEPVEALMALAGADDAPLPERNLAIWALGQLGASEALPLLESMVTSARCEHGSVVCQHEVAKAIDLCSGSFNLSAFVWRHGEVAAR